MSNLRVSSFYPSLSSIAPCYPIPSIEVETITPDRKPFHSHTLRRILLLILVLIALDLDRLDSSAQSALLLVLVLQSTRGREEELGNVVVVVEVSKVQRHVVLLVGEGGCGALV